MEMDHEYRVTFTTPWTSPLSDDAANLQADGVAKPYGGEVIDWDVNVPEATISRTFGFSTCEAMTKFFVEVVVPVADVYHRETYPATKTGF